ncbi:TonB-dependent receptor plug domain-containing protein [Desertibaculum subflavum]|uniref:TonB-dependent receptor plug domain-containing protein n=1 Tax=Desertibaculum subflavum TaxID=2268458 RepID=UPI000E6622EA
MHKSSIPGTIHLLLLASGPAAAQEVSLLPALVVTASRIETPLASVGSSVTVIDREQLDQRRTRAVSDILREAPGLAINRSGGLGASTQLRIRGAEANHTLVLIDGIEVNDVAFGSEFDFGQLLAEDVERIEIVRGAQSALWGSDAIGGVVNIITRKGEGPPRARLAGEAGTRETYQASGGLSGSGEQYHYALSVNRFGTAGISAADKRDGNGEEDSFRNTSGSLRAGINPTEFVSFDVVGRIETARGQTDGFAPVANVVDDRSRYAYMRRYGRAQGMLKLFDDMWEHRLGAAIADTDHSFYDDSGALSTNDGRKKKLDYQTTLHLDMPGFARASHALTFAAEREREEIASISAFSSVVRSAVNYGYVGEYRVTLFDDLALSGALRFDDNDIFENATTYRLTASYRVTDWGTRFKASHGTGVKNPTMFELFGFTSTFNGNPNLRPEKARTYDAGIEQQLLGGRLVADVTGFASRIQDLITGAGATSINVEGISRIEGVETSLRWQALDWLRLGASYTFMDPEDANGRWLVRRPKHIGSVNATATFDGGRGTFFLGAKYNGPSKDLTFDAMFNTTRVKLDGYWLVDAAASYAITEHVELFGRLENLFNEHYQEVFGYGSLGFGAFAGLRIRL